MKIGIAGYGFVGRAHHEVLKLKHDVVINDPALDYTDSLDDVDAVIICVSTPQKQDGSCHIDNVYDVVERCPDVPILIKSTISVEGWRMLKDTFPNSMLNFSPEFLREATWLDDIKNMKLMLIGGTSCTFWSNVFDVDIEIAEPEELILTKYARNSFLALKVSFFNQIYDLCEALDIEYEAVAHYTGMDPRITQSHTQVTKQRGFGGHCFPKDTSAFLNTANKVNIDLSILQNAVDYNKKVRRK